MKISKIADFPPGLVSVTKRLTVPLIELVTELVEFDELAYS